MRLAVVLGQGVRQPRGLPATLPVVSLAGFLAAPHGVHRMLVLGSTADVAAAAAATAGIPIAFAGPSELSRLFALDRSIAAALVRLHEGTVYPVDLGRVECDGTAHAFLGTVTAGAGTAGGGGFPWAGRQAAVAVTGDRRTLSTVARAVVVANSQHWRRWTVAPRAAMNDSLLEIQTFGGPRIGLWSLRRALALGLHSRHPGVNRMATAAASVVTPPSWAVRADGALVGRGPFRVALSTGAATLLI